MSRPVRPGEVLRLDRLGPIVPDEGHDVVALFLGACRKEDEPDAAAYLRQIGFARTHCFELALHHDKALNRWTFTADSPRDALESAVRFARWFETDGPAYGPLRGLTLCLVRLGPIGSDGAPHDGYGSVFVRWSVDSGVPLEDLLKPA